jgi:hypothetical protein
VHISDERGWLVMDDVPENVLPGRWSVQDVEDIIDDMAATHAEYWDQPQLRSRFPWLSHFIDRERSTYDWARLRNEFGPYFEEGPSATVSDHALRQLGRLAPRFLEAANGLAVMRALGGWPGVLGESHLAAVSDLLDDPIPMLEPLARLPQTLLHGDMHIHHWHVTLFDQRRLLDWSNVMLGPAVYDLISFLERFDLVITGDSPQPVGVRQNLPINEETMIDSYMLAMKAELGSGFDAREMRLAIPAARCLQTIVNWFPYFAGWFDKMPDVYTWQRVNRASGDELGNRALGPLLVYRPFLRQVFKRFLQAYRML